MTSCDVTTLVSEKLVSNHLFLPYYHSSSKLEFLWSGEVPGKIRSRSRQDPVRSRQILADTNHQNIVQGPEKWRVLAGAFSYKNLRLSELLQWNKLYFRLSSYDMHATTCELQFIISFLVSHSAAAAHFPSFLYVTNNNNNKKKKNETIVPRQHLRLL